MSETKGKKRMSKKRRVIGGIVVLILIKIIFSIVSPFFIIPSEIKELNKNINLPYKFAYPIEDYKINKEEWKHLTEEGYIYSHIDVDGTIFKFCRFPDLLCSHKFMYFSTSNNQYSIFGINVGDTKDYADKILKKAGYKIDLDDEYYVTYDKGRISIDISYKNSEIKDNEMLVEEISISLFYTDWFHKGNYK